MVAFSLKQNLSLLALVLLAWAMSASFALAAANPQMNYQGKLTTPTGVAVPDGTYNMRFWLVTSPSIATSSAVWTESLTTVGTKVQVTNGLFSVMLGSSTPLTAVDFNRTLYLGVEIGGTGAAVWDGEMSPRKILGTVPAAFVAGYAATAGVASSSDSAVSLGGVASSSFLRSDEADTMAATSTGSLLTLIQNGAGAVARFFSGAAEVFTILQNGNVGIGTNNPGYKLEVGGVTAITPVNGTVLKLGINTDSPTSSPVSIDMGGTYSDTPGVNPKLMLYNAGGLTLGFGFSANEFDYIAHTAGTHMFWSGATRDARIFSDGVRLPSTSAYLFTSDSGLTTPDTGLARLSPGIIKITNGSSGNGSLYAGGSANNYFAGNVGIGSTTPSSPLTVIGNGFFTGTVSGASAIAANDFITLSQFSASTTNSFLNNGNVFGGLATLGTNDNFGLAFKTNGTEKVRIDQNGNLGIGTTTPSARLSIVGAAGSSTVLSIASSTGSSTLALLANGNLELPGQLISAGLDWKARTAAATTTWNSVTFGNGLYVAVGDVGSGNRVMTSPDGINWTSRAASESSGWLSVTYGSRLFVAVANTGTNRVMTSPDGINWTSRSAAEGNAWQSVTYGSGIFVAVSSDGTNRVMTSPDGVNWTARTAANANWWNAVSYGNGLFVASANFGSSPTKRVMTSSNGISWTERTTDSIGWRSITYGNGLFVGVSDYGTDPVMTSPDGATWTSRSAPSLSWRSVTYGNGLFVALSDGGNAMTSPDGIAWTERTLPVASNWRFVTYGNGQFVGVAAFGTTQVITSGKQSENLLAANNIYQGGASFLGGLRAGTTSTSVAASIFLQGEAGKNPFAIASSTGASLLTLTQAGNLGLGTTTPGSMLTVAGNTYIGGALTALGQSSFVNASTTNLTISGRLFDTTNSAGTAGFVLQTTGTSTRWVATSTLGIASGASTFLTLTDTPSSYTANRLLFTNSGATALTDSSALVFDGTNFGIGTSTPNSRLTIQGAAGTANTLTIASSTGKTTLALLSNGDMEMPGQIISQGVNWTSRNSAADNGWLSVTYGNGLFVAVAFSGTGNRVMTSPDGINWTSRTSAADNGWVSVTYGNGLFVAVAFSGTGNRVMTSPDGINWTSRTSAADNSWNSVTYGNGLFVAVSLSGAGNRVMTSPDGINWTSRTSAADNDWYSVAYGNGLFVAVSHFGTGNRVMTSPDGINWTSRTSAADNSWDSVAYGNGLFVAVSTSGLGNRVMTSPDGINWTNQLSAADNNWNSVAYGNGLFVAVSASGSGNTVMTSPDGINWTSRTSATGNLWNSVAYGNGLFVAVAYSGSGNRVMTSGKQNVNQLAANNVYQGGASFIGGLRAGTTSTSVAASIFLQGEAGKNPFAIASSTGASLLTLTQAGRLGLGTTTPTALLSVVDEKSYPSGNASDVLYVKGGSAFGDGGAIKLISGDAGLGAGGNITLQTGSGDSGGNINLITGSGLGAKGGNVNIISGSGFVGGDISMVSGKGSFSDGNININATGTGMITLGSLAGNVAIGNVTPTQKLTIGGNLRLTGAIFDGANASGTLGMILQTTGTSTRWVATSTLGIASGASTFLTLTDTPSSYTANRLLFTNSGATALTDSSALVFDGTNFGIGTSTPSSRLTIQGAAGTANTLTIASSTGKTTLALLSNGNMELPGQLISAGIEWKARTAAEANSWTSITYGNGLFVAVGHSGTNRVMTSPDGINWTARSAAGNNDHWTSITYGNGLFVAVGDECVYSGDCVMTSPDGSNWTARVAPAANDWDAVTYGNGLFVAVAASGFDRVMTSPDGITWTSRHDPEINQWQSVTYGNGLFVAVSAGGTKRVITSTDGITWTGRSAAEANGWRSVTYGNGQFVAVAWSGTNRVMTSPDGINWASQSASEAAGWYNITYGNGLYVAVSNDGTNQVMTSPDGINWTGRSAPENNLWYSVAYGNGQFVAVSYNGTNRVMTSGKQNVNQLAANNVYQGGASFMGGLRAGTTSTSVAASIFLQGEAGKNPFAVASSTGASLLTLTQAGNLGLGTTTPFSLLSMERLDITGNATAGIFQNFTFTNSTASAVQYGNRSVLSTSNTATTSLVASAINISDSSTYGNTVRGLEVQADLGTNTLGENTALSGFARTFGVRGVTSGDAGATFEPAGVYGETTGTTQGNAIRGYSSSITTASLLKLFQDTSSFAGTGLLMNFGNAGGSFSSSTASNFIDLKNAGTTRFKIGGYGMLTIGDGGTGQNAGIQIGNGGICVDNDGACTASTTGRITSVSATTGNSDLAEMYFSSQSLKTGEIVSLTSGLTVGRADRANSRTVLGVVSTLPGVIMGGNDVSLNATEDAYPIALKGRVPVLLSTENGPITVGDELMLSSIPGVAMKASSTGYIVGVALEDFDDTRAYSETYINQFGESIVVPEYTPIDRVSDPRVNDGCYYGGGRAADDEPCVPLKSTTTIAQYDEADALILHAAKERALRALARTASLTKETPLGESVSVGQIVMFVDLRYRYLDERGLAMVEALMASTTSLREDGEVETVWQRLVTLAENFVDGVLSVFTLKADRVETNELCVDGVCVNANDLRRMLEQPPAVTPPPVPDTTQDNDEDDEPNIPPLPPETPPATTTATGTPPEPTEFPPTDTGTSTDDGQSTSTPPTSLPSLPPDSSLEVPPPAIDPPAENTGPTEEDPPEIDQTETTGTTSSST